VTPLETLDRRRDLVLISCDLQRVTMAVRLERLERHRALAWSAALLAAPRLVRSAR
jgi:predicted membrane-bound mannosyltransferase